MLFVGQLSYETESSGIFEHFKKGLGEDHPVTSENLKVRLLTTKGGGTDGKKEEEDGDGDDPEGGKKSKKSQSKSRGMAFLDLSDPELMYACLKMHHTDLDGRRINVERSAGGKSGSEARKEKISGYRKDQEGHMSETVEKVRVFPSLSFTSTEGGGKVLGGVGILFSPLPSPGQRRTLGSRPLIPHTLSRSQNLR